MDHPFRTSALGGFHRQDVLDYVEEQSRKASQQQEQSQQQLDEAKEQRERLEQELEELRREHEVVQRELEAVGQERDGLRERLEQAERELSASRTREGESAQMLEQMRGERDAIQAKLEEITPDAQAYVQLKDRTAGVELDAHCRAQAIQQQAEQEANRLRKQVDQWLQGVEERYCALCSQVESTASHAAQQLQQAHRCLEQLSEMMGEQDQVLDEFRQVCAVTQQPRIEAPMPIPESE